MDETQYADDPVKDDSCEEETGTASTSEVDVMSKKRTRKAAQNAKLDKVNIVIYFFWLNWDTRRVKMFVLNQSVVQR